MPLFKFSWQNPDINAAVVDLQPGVILLDFSAHEDPIRAIIETHSQMSLDFYAINIPAISIPAIIPYFSIIESDSLEATITASLSCPIPYFLITDQEEPGVLVSIAADIKVAASFEINAPNLNEARVYLTLKTRPYFETYVPIICDIDISVKILASIQLYHPVFANIGTSVSKVTALFNTTSENIGFVDLSLSPPELLFFCFTEQTLSIIDFSFSPFVIELRAINTESLIESNEEIIRFEYERWMFEMLKAKHPELTDEDIIKFIEIGGPS